MGLSPMMTHYLQVKEQYKDCIIFYRLGDFYEMFFDDAVKVSSLLDLTLTGRDCGLEERAPMCGIPFHASETYIAKLVALGEKVAICEQLTSPNGKQLVERDVIKVVTAGTVTNNELIDEKSNNFLASVYYKDDFASVSWADITTGDFFVRNFSHEDNVISSMLDILARISPVEIISNDACALLFNEMPVVRHGILPKFSAFTESEFNFSNAKNSLFTQFNVVTLAPFGIEEDKACVISSGALISYLKETQKRALLNIKTLKMETGNDFLKIDATAIKNLELVKSLRDNKAYGSLLWFLDKTKTSMGARKLQSWILTPLNNKEKINNRLNGVESLFKNTLIRQTLGDLLCAVKDVSRITGKISNGNLMPKDCLVLADSLEILPNVEFHLSGLDSVFIKEAVNKFGNFENIVKLLKSAIKEELPPTMKDGGYIKSGFDPLLDEYRSMRDNAKSIISQIEAREREKTGIKTLKIGYNRVFGYYIEVTNSFKHLVPYDYERKQTLTGGERFVTQELREVEVKILTSDEKALQKEVEIFDKIRAELSSHIESLLETADALSDLDVILSLATIAREYNYVKPEMVDSGNELKITDGRHPVVEGVSKQRFVPNDCLMDNIENRMVIITGPNMAGKSTYMRQIALITLMAHMGSFVPASKAVVPITDKIFTRIGASDNLVLDQSTFMVEMTEVANILNNATKNSLVILDEIGRGTSTYDGLSIAWAVVEYMCETIGAKTMFATHYHELTELEGVISGVKNYKVSVKETPNGIIFLRKIMRGGTNKSFGIEVAKLAGVNSEVTEKAKNILKRLERKDITSSKNISNSQTNLIQEQMLSETERIIKDLDVNNMTPMQAFNLLMDLHEKVQD